MTATQEKSIVDGVPRGLFIGGEWRDASGGDTLDVEDPSTGEAIASVADAFGMPAWRIEAVDDFGPTLRRALSLDVPSLIVLPIDYSLDVAISEELGTETVVA